MLYKLSKNIVIRDYLFIITILTFMFSGLIWNCFCVLDSKFKFNYINNDEFFKVMGRSKEFYAGFNNGRFFSGIFQDRLEKASSDYFPILAIFSFKKIERYIDKISLSIFPDSSVPLLPVGGDVLYFRNKQILSRTPVTVSQGINNKLTIQADTYNQLLNSNPSLKMIIVPVLSKADWVVMTRSLDIQTDLFRGDLYVRKFRTLLDPRIDLFWPGEKESPENAIQLYFKTDHHLNIRGIYGAYMLLFEKIFPDSKQYPNHLVPLRWFSIPKLEFRGSEARRAGKFENLFDTLEDGLFSLPEYKVYMDGVFSDVGYNKNRRQNYQNGYFDDGKFVNHYANYFGENYGLVEFVNESSIGNNILFIGDSFDNALSPLIAAHFYKSFFVDLRSFDKRMKTKFSIKKFINDNNIKVLVFFSQQLSALGLRNQNVN